MRNLRSSLCLIAASTLLTTICAATLCFAEAPDRIAGTIDSSKMVTLSYQIQRRAQPQYDQGRVDGSFQLNCVKLFLVPSASQVKALKQLLEEQQDPKSPNFHKWLTPQQYADRFGLSQNDVLKISAWLKSQGFIVGKVANGRDWINFSGTASQIESAFHTEIHRYDVNGEKHFANSTPPSIPAALSGIATGFLGLDDFRPKPMIKKAVPRARTARPGYYDANTPQTDFLAPNDIATIYDLGPLYTAGIDGTGEKLLIAGQTDVYLADLVNFRSGFGLPAIYSGCTANGSGVLTSCTTSSTANFQYILDPNSSDPGVSTGDLGEADLDLEWSAATARGAQIIFYNSTNVFNSLLDAIDNATVLAPVISISYGNCEWNLGGAVLTTSGPGILETGMMQANSLGITILNSSGDSGSAECDGAPGLATGGLSVSYPASSPEVTGVGGTALVYPTGFSTTYWNTSDSADNGGTAQNPPLPETAWNDDVELTLISTSCSSPALTVQENCGIIQSGGGVSNCALQNDPSDTACVSGFPQPTWQSGLKLPTAPPTTARLSPDVSLLASPNFPGYVYCTPVEELSKASPYDTETTSSCASSIASAVNGLPVGDPTTVSPSIVGGTSASAPIFAGLVTMLNQYLSATGGLGNINPKLYQLAATPANGAFHQVTTGTNMVYCQAGTPSIATTTYAYFSSMPEYQCPGTTGTQVFGWNASNADATTGYNLVTGLGSVDANVLFTAWQASLGSFTLTPNPTSLAVIAGNTSPSTTITLTPSGSFNTPVTYSCSAGGVAGTTCNFTPSTATLSPVTLTIATAASMQTGAVPVTVSATGGGVTETTTVTLNVSATNQTFQLAQSGSATLQVNPGQTGTAFIGVTGTNGFSTAITFSCIDPAALLASGATPCAITPATPTTTFPVSLTIPTAAPTAQLHPPLGRGTGIFYAVLLPGLLGIVFTAGSRKRAARGIRFLSLIVVLGFSTLWLGSCSSNSNSNKSPGTPAGSYIVTVNATTGGVNPVTATTTVTLVVQ
jgi:subtilase family serine protease